MSKNNFFSAFVVVLLGVLLLSACSENDCSLGGRPSARFNFIDAESKKQVSLFDSLTITSIGTDSILLNRAKSINHVTLPLNYIATETTYILKYNRELHDTIWLKHKNIPHFISMDCGVDMFYEIDSVGYTKHGLDSIVLRNADINDTEKENFQIYYTTKSSAN